jgi:perosamine synthetase
MGEGGFITTTDERLCDKMQYIRDHGMSRTKKYWHRLLGFNFRLTNLQAAVGCAQLENIDDIITARKRVYNAYLSRLQNMPSIIMQEFSSSVKPIVWTVAIRIKPNHFRMSRDCITKKLLSYGIETRPGFYPFSSMPIYNAPPLKVSEEVARTVICLPTFCELTEKEISYICDRLKGLAG